MLGSDVRIRLVHKVLQLLFLLRRGILGVIADADVEEVAVVVGEVQAHRRAHLIAIALQLRRVRFRFRLQPDQDAAFARHVRHAHVDLA